MRHLKKCARVLVAIIIGVATIGSFWPGAAHANQLPSGCNSNSLDLTIAKDRTNVRQGSTIQYAVYITNLDNGSSIACDITGATVTLRLPAADGTPTGTSVTLATSVDYPAGTASTLVGTSSYVVAVNPGVTDVVAEGNVSGTLHDAPVDHAASITKTVGTSVTRPSMLLSKTASPSRGQAPLTVTFTYTVTNTSSTNAPLEDVTITDSNCSGMTFTGGDPNANNLLDVGEAWIYTCKRTFTARGTFTNTAQVQATNTIDNGSVTSNQAQISVVVRPRTTGLPGLPNTGVHTVLTPAQWWHMFLHDAVKG